MHFLQLAQSHLLIKNLQRMDTKDAKPGLDSLQSQNQRFLLLKTLENSLAHIIHHPLPYLM